jgi:hypothetical protein
MQSLAFLWFQLQMTQVGKATPANLAGGRIDRVRSQLSIFVWFAVFSAAMSARSGITAILDKCKLRRFEQKVPGYFPLADQILSAIKTQNQTLAATIVDFWTAQLPGDTANGPLVGFRQPPTHGGAAQFLPFGRIIDLGEFLRQIQVIRSDAELLRVSSGNGNLRALRTS